MVRLLHQVLSERQIQQNDDASASNPSAADLLAAKPSVHFNAFSGGGRRLTKIDVRRRIKAITPHDQQREER